MEGELWNIRGQVPDYPERKRGDNKVVRMCFKRKLNLLQFEQQLNLGKCETQSGNSRSKVTRTREQENRVPVTRPTNYDKA